MSTSKKRSSPGAETAKNGDPFADVDIGKEEEAILTKYQKQIQRVELILERRAQEHLTPVYLQRREALKSIHKFWPVALLKHSMFALQAQHDADRVALSYLEDVWVLRDSHETKVFTLEFYFKENPYFSDTVLKKEYKFEPSNAAPNDEPDADGITPSMLAFSWERDVTAQATKIQWKDDSKNLTKLYPLKVDEDDDTLAEPGSFFNFFEVARDYHDLGVVIANEVFPDAIDYFRGDVGGDELYSDEEDEESDDEDENEEIDLEKPRAKRPKQE